MVGEFNTPVTSIDRSSKQKINKATEILNDKIEESDLTDIFKTLHQKENYKIKKRIYILFNSTWNIL